MIKEYWGLIGREPFLVITWEPDFSQACSFCRMLINHKNLHFTQIPGKTNDVIFFQSPKTMFLGHFWSFLPDVDFFQKIPLCHTQLYMGPFQKKLMSQFWGNLWTDRRTNERTDGRTLFYRTLLANAGGPIINISLFTWDKVHNE